MEIHNGNHVRPTALPALELEHQRIYPWLKIPVYVINAVYLWPITIWAYLKYGRPVAPWHGEKTPSHSAHSKSHAFASGGTESVPSTHSMIMNYDTREPDGEKAEEANSEVQNSHASKSYTEGNHHAGGHHHGNGERPIFATITVAVLHCRAGCVFGDIVGEWLVYGTGAAINGRMLWIEYLMGTCPLSFIISDHVTKSSHRLCFCNCVWHCLSVLFDRDYGWGTWTEDTLWRGESRFPIIDCL